MLNNAEIKMNVNICIHLKKTINLNLNSRKCRFDNKCRNKDNCKYLHTTEEESNHEDQNIKKICWFQARCRVKDCKFIHKKPGIHQQCKLFF